MGNDTFIRGSIYLAAGRIVIAGSISKGGGGRKPCWEHFTYRGRHITPLTAQIMDWKAIPGG
jgi:hypothetical protein